MCLSKSSSDLNDKPHFWHEGGFCGGSNGPDGSSWKGYGTGKEAADATKDMIHMPFDFGSVESQYSVKKP
jgi:hypothetical protein